MMPCQKLEQLVVNWVPGFRISTSGSLIKGVLINKTNTCSSMPSTKLYNVVKLSDIISTWDMSKNPMESMRMNEIIPIAGNA